MENAAECRQMQNDNWGQWMERGCIIVGARRKCDSHRGEAAVIAKILGITHLTLDGME